MKLIIYLIPFAIISFAILGIIHIFLEEIIVIPYYMIVPTLLYYFKYNIHLLIYFKISKLKRIHHERPNLMKFLAVHKKMLIMKAITLLFLSGLVIFFTLGQIFNYPHEVWIYFDRNFYGYLFLFGLGIFWTSFMGSNLEDHSWLYFINFLKHLSLEGNSNKKKNLTTNDISLKYTGKLLLFSPIGLWLLGIPTVIMLIARGFCVIDGYNDISKMLSN